MFFLFQIKKDLVNSKLQSVDLSDINLTMNCLNKEDDDCEKSSDTLRRRASGSPIRTVQNKTIFSPDFIQTRSYKSSFYSFYLLTVFFCLERLLVKKNF